MIYEKASPDLSLLNSFECKIFSNSLRLRYSLYDDKTLVTNSRTSLGADSAKNSMFSLAFLSLSKRCCSLVKSLISSFNN